MIGSMADCLVCAEAKPLKICEKCGLQMAISILQNAVLDDGQQQEVLKTAVKRALVLLEALG